MSNAAKLRKKAAEFEQQKQYDKAIQHYKRALEEIERSGEEQDVTIFNRVGDLLIRQGAVTEAVTYLDRAVDLYAATALYNNAIALCNKILRHTPGRSATYLTLGRICARKGLKGDATRNFVEYAARMQQAGRVEEALAALVEFVDLVPEQSELRGLLEAHVAKSGARPSAEPGDAPGGLPRAAVSGLTLLETAGTRLTPPVGLAGITGAARQFAVAASVVGATVAAARVVPELVFLDVDYDVATVPGLAPRLTREVERPDPATLGAPSLVDEPETVVLSSPVEALPDLQVFTPTDRLPDGPAPIDGFETTLATDGLVLLSESLGAGVAGLVPTRLDGLPDSAPSVADAVAPLAGLEGNAPESPVVAAAVASAADQANVAPSSGPAGGTPPATEAVPLPAPPRVETPVTAAPPAAMVERRRAPRLGRDFRKPPSLDGLLILEDGAKSALPTPAEALDAVPPSLEAPVEALVDVPVEAVVEAVNEAPVEEVVESPVDAGVEPLVEAMVEPLVEATVEPLAEAGEDAPVALTAASDAPHAAEPQHDAPADMVLIDTTGSADDASDPDAPAPPAMDPLPEMVSVLAPSEEASTEPMWIVLEPAVLAGDALSTDAEPVEPADPATIVDPSPTVVTDDASPALIQADDPPSTLVPTEEHDTGAGDWSLALGAGEPADAVDPHADTPHDHSAPDPVLPMVAATAGWVVLDDVASPGVVEPASVGSAEGQAVWPVAPSDVADGQTADQTLADGLDLVVIFTPLESAVVSTEVAGHTPDSGEAPTTPVLDGGADAERLDEPVHRALATEPSLAAIVGSEDAETILVDWPLEEGFALSTDRSVGAPTDVGASDDLGLLLPWSMAEDGSATALEFASDADEARSAWALDPHDLALPGELPPLDLPGAPLDGLELVADAGDDDVDLGFDFEWDALEEATGDDGEPGVDGLPGQMASGDTAAHITSGHPDRADAAPTDGWTPGDAVTPDAEAVTRSDAGRTDGLEAIDSIFGVDSGSLEADRGLAADRIAVARAPYDWRARRRLTDALFGAGDLDGAVAVLLETSTLLEERGRLADAAQAIDEVVRVRPNAVDAHQRRVELAVRAEDPTRLKESYLDLADALLRLGEGGKSQAVFLRVLELDPWDVRARAALGPAAPPAPARPPEAYVEFGAWLQEDTARSTRLVMAAPEPTGDEEADFQYLLQRFKAGVADAVGDDDHDSHYDLGVAYKEMGLLDDAIAEFQKALRGRHHRLRSYEALGQCFVEQRNFQVAVTVLSRALAESGLEEQQLVGVCYLLGYASEGLQRWAEARRYYERVYATDITFRDVAARLAALDRSTR